MKNVNIGDRVKASFEFEIDAMHKSSHKEGQIDVRGWIMEGDKCICLVTVPLSVCKVIQKGGGVHEPSRD